MTARLQSALEVTFAAVVWGHDGSMLIDYLFGSTPDPPTGTQGSPSGYARGAANLSALDLGEPWASALLPASPGAYWSYDYGGAWSRVDTNATDDGCVIGPHPPAVFSLFVSQTFDGSSCGYPYLEANSHVSKIYYALEGMVPASIQPYTSDSQAGGAPYTTRTSPRTGSTGHRCSQPSRPTYSAIQRSPKNSRP